jgi:hypothetical protein
MKPGRVVALVIGCLVALPGIGMLIAGTTLGLTYAFGRDDDGYFDFSLDRIESATPAIMAEDLDFTADPGTPGWLLDALDVDLRLRVTDASGDGDIFVGIGPEADVDGYLDGVAHDQVVDLDGREAEYRSRPGSDEAPPPTDQDFWEVSASGPGTQQVEWETSGGRWAAVVMNADGSAGVSADVDVGIRPDILLPLAIGLLIGGLILTAGGVALIVIGATGGRAEPEAAPPSEPGAPPPSAAAPPAESPADTPVALTATLDADLSRWQWLVKWFLAIPHFIVHAFLWLAFLLLTIVAFFAILFTARYPRGIFEFNVGVLRWTWRVTYYAATGGLGTDRYPPFRLGPDPDYPAELTIEYPERLSRGLVLVKWWLLAIPQYVIVGLLIGGWYGFDRDVDRTGPGAPGLVQVLVLIAAVILLFTGRYRQSLFDLIVGLNRWLYRVGAYATLMTDRYPPFRLDQGGDEPARERPPDETPTPPPSEIGSGDRP